MHDILRLQRLAPTAMQADHTLLRIAGAVSTEARSQDAAKMAAREDAKKMKNLRQPGSPNVGLIWVGQKTEKATRY